MKPAENIKRLIENAKVKIDPEVKEAALKQLINELERPETTTSAATEPSVWRIIMKSRMVKIAAAAMITIAAVVSISQLAGGVDGASVVWGQVVKRAAEVDYVHFYAVTNYKEGFPAIREGWYAHGKLRTISCGGYSSYGAYQSFDDGQRYINFDRHNNITVLQKSNLERFPNIFELMADGMLSFDFSQFSDKTPSLAGPDFLIYEFDPPEEANWIEKIAVTVGRNSLMPIQIKTYYKVEKWYSRTDLVLFDFEEPEKPVEFFEMPSETKPPHGVGRVVLGGQEVEIELHDAPGIKKAIVRLHTKFDGPAEEVIIPLRERYELEGGPMYYMEITFVTDEGYRSNTSKNCPLWLNRGTKAALGKAEVWPDRKHRNIRYTPVLRATDDENVFMLEISCWLRIRETEL